MPLWVLILYLFGLGLFASLVGFLFYKRMRRAVPEAAESKRLTKGMPWSRRFAISRTVRRGEAVRDPRDARAAAAIARSLLATLNYLDRSRWRRFVEVGVVVYAGLVVVQAVRDGRAPSLNDLWHIGLAVAFLLYLVVWRPRTQQRLQRGLEANQRLLELNLPPTPPEAGSTEGAAVR
jgi:hypothetical protein